MSASPDLPPPLAMRAMRPLSRDMIRTAERVSICHRADYDWRHRDQIVVEATARGWTVIETSTQLIVIGNRQPVRIITPTTITPGVLTIRPTKPHRLGT